MCTPAYLRLIYMLHTETSVDSLPFSGESLDDDVMTFLAAIFERVLPILEHCQSTAVHLLETHWTTPNRHFERGLYTEWVSP